LCIGLLWFGKRWLAARAPLNGQGQQLRFLETLSLGIRCALRLIHVADRPVLVGMDASGFRTIVSLPESSLEHALDFSIATGSESQSE
jgi:flagellar biogenesis protein FliO